MAEIGESDKPDSAAPTAIAAAGAVRTVFISYASQDVAVADKVCSADGPYAHDNKHGNLTRLFDDDALKPGLECSARSVRLRIIEVAQVNRRPAASSFAVG